MIKLGTKTRLILACALLTLVVSVFSVVAALAASNVSLNGSVTIQYKLYELYSGQEFNNTVSNIVNNNGNITKLEFDYRDSFLIRKNVNDYGAIEIVDNIDAYYHNLGYDDTLYIVSSGEIVAPVDASYMFSGMENLTSITFNNFNTHNTTNMSYMFSGCGRLQSLDVSGFNTSNVTNMSNMFALTYEEDDGDGHYLLYPNTNLHQITGLTNLETGKVENMSSMFTHCVGLTSLDLSNFDTSNVTDMRSMFSYCAGLSEITLSEKFNTSKVENMGYMFSLSTNESHYSYVNTALTSLVLPSSFSTDNVTYMNSMFSGCAGLTSLDLSNWNTRNVTDMSNMFLNCSGLKEIDLSGYNCRGNATNMGYMFYNCSSLENLKIPYFHMHSAKNLSYMFYNCSSLKSLDLSYAKPTSCTNMSAMFSGCSGLTSLDLSEFRSGLVTNMSSMFSGCSGLTSLDLTNFYTYRVTSMSSMFSGCSGLTELDLSEFYTESLTSTGSMFRNCTNLGAIYVAPGLWDMSNVTSSTNMFSGCTNLKGERGTAYSSSYINKDYARIDQLSGSSAQGYLTGAYSLLLGSEFNSAINTLIERVTSNIDIKINISFGSMEDLTSSYNDYVSVGDDDGIKMYSYYGIGNQLNFKVLSYGKIMAPFEASNMFDDYNYTSGTSRNRIQSITFNNFNTRRVWDMSGMFYACTQLTSLDLSCFDTSDVDNMSSMFSLCSGLTSLNVSSFDTSNVNNMSAMFNGCSSLTNLNILNFNTGKVGTMDYMFNGCSSLNGLDLSSFDTSNVTNMASMFEGCANLAVSPADPSDDLIFGSGFNTNKVTNMSRMFANCTNTYGLYLVQFDTYSVTDMSEMFSGCTNLVTIHVHRSDWDDFDFDDGNLTTIHGWLFEDMYENGYVNTPTMTNIFKDCGNLVGKSTGFSATTFEQHLFYTE